VVPLEAPRPRNNDVLLVQSKKKKKHERGILVLPSFSLQIAWLAPESVRSMGVMCAGLLYENAVNVAVGTQPLTHVS
jgi:hypothetical protein